MTTRNDNTHSTDKQLEQMFRGMLKRDLAQLEALLADNPNAGDADRYPGNIKYITEVLQREDFLDFVAEKVATATPGSFWDVGPKWTH